MGGEKTPCDVPWVKENNKYSITPLQHENTTYFWLEKYITGYLNGAVVEGKHGHTQRKRIKIVCDVLT